MLSRCRFAPASECALIFGTKEFRRDEGYIRNRLALVSSFSAAVNFEIDGWDRCGCRHIRLWNEMHEVVYFQSRKFAEPEEI
jgi:hypothetical protein